MNIEEVFDEYYEKSLIQGGNSCCPGCSDPLFWRMVLETLGPDTIIYNQGVCAGCATRALRVPVLQLHFSFVADGASGILAALRKKKMDHITVVSSGGDGSISDISFNKISGAAERNENMIQICVDNEAYMNTGIQKSGLTPFGSITTTTPKGNTNNKKNIPFIIAQHNVPYVATVSVAYPEDLKKKIQKAKSVHGFKFIHAITPCPTGWGFNPSKTIEVGRLGVDTWMTPLYEIEKGVLNLTVTPKQKIVQEYLKIQRRFRALSDEEISSIQKTIDMNKDNLMNNNNKKIIF